MSLYGDTKEHGRALPALRARMAKTDGGKTQTLPKVQAAQLEHTRRPAQAWPAAEEGRREAAGKRQQETIAVIWSRTHSRLL